MPDFMDPSSGVFGEEAFHQLLTREASRATRYQDFFSVCLVRPDSAGPEPDGAMQQALARKITQFLRSTDVVARIREGIAILLLNTPDADAARVAERIRAHLENVSFQSGPAEPARSVTLSMGLVSFPRATPKPGARRWKRSLEITNSRPTFAAAASYARPNSAGLEPQQ